MRDKMYMIPTLFLVFSLALLCIVLIIFSIGNNQSELKPEITFEPYETENVTKTTILYDYYTGYDITCPVDSIRFDVRCYVVTTEKGMNETLVSYLVERHYRIYECQPDIAMMIGKFNLEYVCFATRSINKINELIYCNDNNCYTEYIFGFPYDVCDGTPEGCKERYE